MIEVGARAQGRIVLIGGGVRSGKSRFALARARQLGPRRAFIATAQPSDAEMRARIEAHARERSGEFTTLEAPRALVAALRALDPGATDVVVVDCLTLWLSNLLLDGRPPEAALGEVDALCDVLATRRVHAVLVTNEVGMGVVPESALGRTFRDLSGRAHQRLAQIADEIHFALLGVMLRIRPEPISANPTGEPPCSD